MTGISGNAVSDTTTPGKPPRRAGAVSRGGWKVRRGDVAQGQAAPDALRALPWLHHTKGQVIR